MVKSIAVAFGATMLFAFPPTGLIDSALASDGSVRVAQTQTMMPKGCARIADAKAPAAAIRHIAGK